MSDEQFLFLLETSCVLIDSEMSAYPGEKKEVLGAGSHTPEKLIPPRIRNT